LFFTLILPDDEAFPFHRIRSKVGYKCFRFADPQPDVITEDVKPVNDATSLRGLQVVDVCEEDMFVVHSVFMENLLAPSKRGSKEQSHYSKLDLKKKKRTNPNPKNIRFIFLSSKKTIN